MTYSIVVKRPCTGRNDFQQFVCVETRAIPTVLDAIRIRAAKYWWEDDAAWDCARDMLATFGKDLLMPCGTEIVNAIDRVYVMMDASLNGVSRGVTGAGTDADPFVYSPPLDNSKEADDYVPPSLRSDTNVARVLLHNLATGTPNAVVGDNRNFRDQLAEIIAKIDAGESLDPEMLAELVKIAALLV